MKNIFTEALFPFISAFIIARIVFPLLIKLSPKIGLVDVPNERKVHKNPVPAIGGLVIMLTVLITVALSHSLQQLAMSHIAFSVASIVLTITGVVDDRLNISAKLRFAIQIAAAWAMAYDGTRLQNLYGILGVHELPVLLQYAVTIFIIVGVTNAFNLIDGIDGLAGSIAFINILLLSGTAFLLHDFTWMPLLMTFLGALIIFLHYNWRPAKIFMGDGGSLVFGFVMSAIGISQVESAGSHAPQYLSLTITTITGFTIIPVMDTLRVFYSRIKKERSPFSADKNHLHHWLLKNHMVHSAATSKIVMLHFAIILISSVLVFFIPLSVVIFLQVLIVVLYTRILQIISYFHKWYRVIKKMETATP